jgi:hypothetical protein
MFVSCKINCIKWFSKVLLRLKPRDFDFSTRSLSKYRTTFPLFPIANAIEGMRGEVLCYKFGDCNYAVEDDSVSISQRGIRNLRKTLLIFFEERISQRGSSKFLES